MVFRSLWIELALEIHLKPKRSKFQTEVISLSGPRRHHPSLIMLSITEAALFSSVKHLVSLTHTHIYLGCIYHREIVILLDSERLCKFGCMKHFDMLIC